MKEYHWQILQDFHHVKLSGALSSLYSNQILRQVAGGILVVFFPVFLYQKLNYSLTSVALYFIASFGIWFLIIPLGAKIMSKMGLKKSLIFSVIFGATYYFLLNIFDNTNAL